MTRTAEIHVRADFKAGAGGERGPYYIRPEKLVLEVQADKTEPPTSHTIYPDHYPDREACLEEALTSVFPAHHVLKFSAADRLSIVAMMMAFRSYGTLQRGHIERNVNERLTDSGAGRLSRKLLKRSLDKPDSTLLNFAVKLAGLSDLREDLAREVKRGITIDFTRSAQKNPDVDPLYTDLSEENRFWVYFDTEFNDETVEDYHIDLISFGAVDEADHDYYAESSDMDKKALMRHDWLVANVLPLLSGAEKKPLSTIRQDFTAYLEQRARAHTEATGTAPRAVFCARNGLYDYFLLISLYGGTDNLEKTLKDIGFAGFEYRDFYEFKDRMPKDYDVPEQPGGLHNALADARHLKACIHDMKRRL